MSDGRPGYVLARRIPALADDESIVDIVRTPEGYRLRWDEHAEDHTHTMTLTASTLRAWCKNIIAVLDEGER